MAFMDDAQFIISQIRHSCVTSDDTGMSEIVIVNEETENENLLQKKKFGNWENGLDAFDYSNSFDIEVSPMQGGIGNSVDPRKPVNPKDSKNSEIKCKTISWKDQDGAVSDSELSQVFAKKDIVHDKKDGKKVSKLSEQIKASINQPKNIFAYYGKFDGEGYERTNKVRGFKIFLPMVSVPKGKQHASMDVCLIVDNAHVQDLIGLIMFKYTQQERKPELKVAKTGDVKSYCLLIADELDGEVDFDLPALDNKEMISKFDFKALALSCIQMDEEEAAKETKPKSNSADIIVEVNHCWVSFSGFAEVYNEVYQNEIERFRGHVPDKVLCDTETPAEVLSTDKSARGNLFGEISYKTVAQSYWKKELEEEMDEMGIRSTWVFSSESSIDQGSENQAMEYIEKLRCESLYSHVCSTGCEKKGCGSLYVADGNWKLKYSHCMWKAPIKIDGFSKPINYPNICPLSPERGKAFCENHCARAQKAGIPSGLHEFLIHCGIEKGETCRETGTTQFIKDNVEFVEQCSEIEETTCNKDTGGRKTLQSWSRGVFFIVSGGGHIEYWQPLYRCEEKRGSSKFAVNKWDLDMGVVMEKMLKKRGLKRTGHEYVLVKKGDPGTAISLDDTLDSMQTLQFQLVKRTSIPNNKKDADKDKNGKEIQDQEFFTSSQYKSFKVTMLHRFRATSEVQLGIDKKNIEIHQATQPSQRTSFLNRSPKAVTIEMDYVVDSEVIKKSGNRSIFRIIYCTAANHHDFKSYDFECSTLFAGEIVRKIELILNASPKSDSQLEYQKFKDKRTKKS